MSLDEITEHERIPILEERIENLRRANTAQNRYYVECDMKTLSVLNPRLYEKYLKMFKIANFYKI